MTEVEDINERRVFNDMKFVFREMMHFLHIKHSNAIKAGKNKVYDDVRDRLMWSGHFQSISLIAEAKVLAYLEQVDIQEYWRNGKHVKTDAADKQRMRSITKKFEANVKRIKLVFNVTTPDDEDDKFLLNDVRCDDVGDN